MLAATLSTFAAIAVSALAQPEDRAPFQARDGYDEARYGSQELTIRTRTGDRTVRVSFSKLRVAQTAKPAIIRWQGPGLGLVQHAAGKARVVVRGEQFEPLEAEWLRIALPAQLSISTNDDTVQLDLVLIEERAR